MQSQITPDTRKSTRRRLLRFAAPSRGIVPSNLPSHVKICGGVAGLNSSINVAATHTHHLLAGHRTKNTDLHSEESPGFETENLRTTATLCYLLNALIFVSKN